MERIGKRHDNHNTSSGDRGGVPSIQCRLRAARNELFRRLSKGVKGNDIILSKLSTDGKWVALFDGPTKQLDITWITSMNSKPLLSEVYRSNPVSSLIDSELKEWLPSRHREHSAPLCLWCLSG